MDPRIIDSRRNTRNSEAAVPSIAATGSLADLRLKKKERCLDAVADLIVIGMLLVSTLAIKTLATVLRKSLSGRVRTIKDK